MIEKSDILQTLRQSELGLTPEEIASTVKAKKGIENAPGIVDTVRALLDEMATGSDLLRIV